VVKRALTTSDPNDVQFKAGASVPVAFAVWDGANVERNGMKGISTWFTLKLP
jgi:DMSO reductase family type II enzyme heme b subunit